MAKSTEHQQLQDSNRCNTASVPCFECFQIQQSIGVSIESIDSSHRHFLSRQQRRFFKATFQLHQSRNFQHQALIRIASNSGCTFNFASGLSSSKKMSSSDESESNEECHCLDWSWNINTDVLETFFKLSSSLSTWFCTWMNFPNVARYGREMPNAHQCHPRDRAPLKYFEWFSVNDFFLSFSLPL